MVEASKASTGNLTLNMNNLDFVEMLHQVIGEFEERFEEHHLTMIVHFPDEPSVIYADGQRLWRVLENIFGNVTKYAMEDTRVYAEVMTPTVRWFHPEKYFRPAVKFRCRGTYRAFRPR